MKRILLLALLLSACTPAQNDAFIETLDATRYPSPTVVTQTPVVIVVTATSAPATVEVAEPTFDRADCRDESPFHDLKVGYVPGLAAFKKSPLVVDLPCALLTITFEGGYFVQGVVSEDGLSLVSCLFYADRGEPYPCSLEYRGPTNYRGFYEHKNGLDFPLCVAVATKQYNEVCSG